MVTTTSNSRNYNEDRNAPIAANQRATNSVDLIAWWRLEVLQSKRRDQQLKAIPSWDKQINVHLFQAYFTLEEVQGKNVWRN